MSTSEAILRTGCHVMTAVWSAALILALTVSPVWWAMVAATTWSLFIMTVHAQAEYDRNKQKGEPNAN